jgi:hypothetical protein
VEDRYDPGIDDSMLRIFISELLACSHHVQLYFVHLFLIYPHIAFSIISGSWGSSSCAESDVCLMQLMVSPSTTNFAALLHESAIGERRPTYDRLLCLQSCKRLTTRPKATAPRRSKIPNPPCSYFWGRQHRAYLVHWTPKLTAIKHGKSKPGYGCSGR